MSPMQRRFKSVIERLGSLVPLNSVGQKMLLTTISPSAARMYMTDGDLQMVWNRPLAAAYVPFDCSAVATDTVSWQGNSYSIARAINMDAGGETVARLLVLV
ncbi:MAG: hypothetical protein JST40_10265 [Armatimonadetes bacterium]|nr:hypothetical protein [Armatimonadota bacterium]